MIIGNGNSYLKNLNEVNNLNNQNSLNKNNGVLQRAINNPINKELQKILSGNDKIATIEKKENNIQTNVDPSTLKIDKLKLQLTSSQAMETKLQEGMSSLQEKDIGLEKIKSAGEKLKELATLYKDSGISEDDKKEITKQAEDLIKGIENLMNNTKSGEKNVVASNDVQIQRADGGVGIISTKGLDIKLDFGRLEEDKLKDLSNIKIGEDKPFESNVSVETLLENSSIIDEKLLKPVEEVMEEVGKAKDYVFDKFVEQYSLVENSIDELFNSGAISKFSKDLKQLNHQMMYDAVSAMRSQSSNINKDNVYNLLK